MSKPFKLQDPGEGIHEVEVLEIHVKPGQAVADGDLAFVVESDKAAIELPAPYDGHVAEILVRIGDTVTVGDVLMTIDTGAGQDTARKDTEEPVQAPPIPIKQLAEPVASAQASVVGSAQVKAAPAARKLAREKGIDLAKVPATGSKGHVTRADVDAFAGGQVAAGHMRIEPLRSIRRATAHQMAKAWADIPHVMLSDLFDMTAAERLRRMMAPAVKEQGGQLTLMTFMIKALCAALLDHPRFNASLDMAAEEIHLHPCVHMGIALDSERGLIVPVLRDAQNMPLLEMARSVKQLAEGARAGKVAPAALKGATITITNIGALGGRGFFPIINPPQVAILGMGRGAVEQVVTSDLDAPLETRLQYRVPVSLSFDHRVNDGADAARLLADLKNRLADPAWMLLLH